MQQNTQTRFENYILYIAVLLTPVLVLNSFPNSFVTPKLAFFTFVIGIVLIIKSIRNIAKNSISFSASSFDLPVILLAVAYLASSVIKTPNKMEAFFSPGSATIIVAGVLGFFIVTQMSRNAKTMLQYVAFGSAVLVSLVILLAGSGVFRSFSSLPLYMQSTAFTTLGGPLPALIFLLASAPLGLSLLFTQNDMAKKAFAGVSLSLIALAAIMSLLNVLPGRDSSPQLPGFNTSWSVAVDSLKQSPLLGMGPGNYLTAFNRYRPISYNATELWPTRFTSAQNFLFTSITETGIVGGAAMILILLFIFKTVRDFVYKNRSLMSWLSPEGSTMVSLIILSAAILLFPTSFSILMLFFMVLAIAATTNVVNLNMLNANVANQNNLPFAARIPVLIAAVPVIIAVALYSFQATRVLSADLAYKRALDAVARNDGRAAYDTLQTAINTNPYVDRYRVSYAQINLVLANAIAQKEQITDEDRQTIAQLVQQAIREGKVAVALNPQRAGNWEVLASIYRAVMPLAQGADVFAAQTYTQAITLDPYNVNTRIALGGIFYAAGNYDDAIDQFQLAAAVKPDHANAHYNLAVAYREAGNLDRAIAQMGTVLSLVDRNSEDFSVASKALEDMQNKRQAETPEGGNLTAPDSGDEIPALEEPIELDEEAAPPETDEQVEEGEASPSPTPTPLP